MIVYIPYYDRGFKVQKIDTTAARLFHNRNGLTRYTIYYRGTLYGGDNIYRTETGAAAYINRDYKIEQEQRIEPETINDWKEKKGC